MATVDVHQHLWPESLVELLVRRVAPPRLVGSTLELPRGLAFEVDLDAHRLETRVALLDRCEIDVAVVSLPPTLGAGELPDDEWEELADAYERGVREVASASERIVALGARPSSDEFPGMCLAAPVLLDVDGIAPLLSMLDERRAFLFVHPGPASPRAGGPDWWPAVVGHAVQMQEAYAAWLAHGAVRWPELRVVFALLAGGGPFQLERLQAHGVSGRDSLHGNVLFETSSYGRRALELCLSTLGVGQVLFGSNAPRLDPAAGLDDVRGFGDAVLEALWNQNPSRLLG
jgi:predicted TIM-barrel fold metal-dependent hydrolase